ncbi:MAG: hypothetical protein KME35_23335 [Aphanocapsa sp. GSE-SYN-MK-11-07L]|jgi:hypothetical protein|nr:hypothetical protein [Aphanocapsa sp. GSE-SYN-MK-11-07L]
MEPPEQLKEKVLSEKRLTNRLRLVTTRLQDAQQEHLWAIAAAKSEGLSIRKIAAATGLSSSRVHQLLHTNEALQLPQWLTSVSDSQSNRDQQSLSKEIQSLKKFQQRLAEESEVMRWCIGWLEQLACGERVVINLRAESDSRTAFVGVDQKWVLRVLNRIAADLDQLSGYSTTHEEGNAGVEPIIAGIKHRQRLAEPEPELSSLSQREQRAILREKMGLSPY